MAPQRRGSSGPRQKGQKGSNGKRSRETASEPSSSSDSISRPQRKARSAALESPAFYYERARRWTTAEVGTPATATGAEVAVAEALGAIDAELVAGCSALSAAKEGDGPRKAMDSFAERARSRVSALTTKRPSSRNRSISSRFDDDDDDDEATADLARALKQQLESERCAQADLDRLLCDEETWREAASKAQQTSFLPLPDDDDDDASPSGSKRQNLDPSARVREALDLKGIAASRLADRAGMLGQALAAAKGAQADLFRAFQDDSSDKASVLRDARRLIRE